MQNFYGCALIKYKFVAPLIQMKAKQGINFFSIYTDA